MAGERDGPLGVRAGAESIQLVLLSDNTVAFGESDNRTPVSHFICLELICSYYSK